MLIWLAKILLREAQKEQARLEREQLVREFEEVVGRSTERRKSPITRGDPDA